MLHYFLVLSCFSSVLLLFYFSFIPYFFLVLFLLFLYVFNGRSPADLADYADECSKAALFRIQKTVSANVSAKADAADNAEKDSYHIVECCLLFIQQICKGTRLLFPCSFCATSTSFPCSLFVRSLRV